MPALPFHPRAVIFDMDGVIVDSMPYHFIAWYEALRPYGVRVNCFEIYAREGEKWDKSLREFLQSAGIPPTRRLMAKIFAERKKIFKKYFRRHLFFGVEDFIACLRGHGYALALVTGTDAREVHRILPRRIQDCFQVIVTGDAVRHGKPHPEPYRTAARKLGLSPSECLVIENAPYGIRSAKAAGMFCVALTSSLPKTYLKGADIVLDRFSEANQLIEKSCKKKK